MAETLLLRAQWYILVMVLQIRDFLMDFHIFKIYVTCHNYLSWTCWLLNLFYCRSLLNYTSELQLDGLDNKEDILYLITSEITKQERKRIKWEREWNEGEVVRKLGWCVGRGGVRRTWCGVNYPGGWGSRAEGGTGLWLVPHQEKAGGG